MPHHCDLCHSRSRVSQRRENHDYSTESDDDTQIAGGDSESDECADFQPTLNSLRKSLSEHAAIGKRPQGSLNLINCSAILANLNRHMLDGDEESDSDAEFDVHPSLRGITKSHSAYAVRDNLLTSTLTTKTAIVPSFPGFKGFDLQQKSPMTQAVNVKEKNACSRWPEPDDDFVYGSQTEKIPSTRLKSLEPEMRERRKMREVDVWSAPSSLTEEGVDDRQVSTEFLAITSCWSAPDDLDDENAPEAKQIRRHSSIAKSISSDYSNDSSGARNSNTVAITISGGDSSPQAQSLPMSRSCGMLGERRGNLLDRPKSPCFGSPTSSNGFANYFSSANTNGVAMDVDEDDNDTLTDEDDDEPTLTEISTIVEKPYTSLGGDMPARQSDTSSDNVTAQIDGTFQVSLERNAFPTHALLPNEADVENSPRKWPPRAKVIPRSASLAQCGQGSGGRGSYWDRLIKKSPSCGSAFPLETKVKTPTERLIESCFPFRSNLCNRQMIESQLDELNTDDDNDHHQLQVVQNINSTCMETISADQKHQQMRKSASSAGFSGASSILPARRRRRLLPPRPNMACTPEERTIDATEWYEAGYDITRESIKWLLKYETSAISHDCPVERQSPNLISDRQTNSAHEFRPIRTSVCDRRVAEDMPEASELSGFINYGPGAEFPSYSHIDDVAVPQILGSGVASGGHRRLPTLPVKSASAALLSSLGPPFSMLSGGSASSHHIGGDTKLSQPEDHRLCFGMDSVIGRSTLMEDSYYEEDGINGNQHLGRKGWLQEDSSGVSSCTASEHLNPTHRVQWAFVPRHVDEILLDPGDAVHVDRECEDHWCYGTNLRTSHQGIFPVAHVVEIDLVDEICMNALPTNVTKMLTEERDTFFLTMLASIEVAHHKGNDVLVQAMNKVLSMYQNREEIIAPQTVLMEISFRGIHIIDKRKKNFFRCPSFDYFYSLQNISFCGAHPKQLRYFGFISKHPLLPRFACHVFLSNESTQAIVEAIGRAFKRSYDEYMAFAHPTEDIYID